MNNIYNNFCAAKYALEILAPAFAFGLVSVLCVSGAYKAHVQIHFWSSTMLLLVFCSFGTTIGMFVGASKSEIVSSLLPPLITLVSAYVAWLGSKDFPDNVKVLIPGGMFVLLLSLLFSAYYMKAWYYILTLGTK